MFLLEPKEINYWHKLIAYKGTSPSVSNYNVNHIQIDLQGK